MFFNHPVKEKNANYRQTDIVFFFFRWYKKHTKIEQTERIAICCIISWICHIATQAGTIDSGHSAFFFFRALEIQHQVSCRTKQVFFRYGEF